jgi:hypothetical protein
MKVLIVYNRDKHAGILDRFPKDTQVDYLDIDTPFESKVKDYDVVYCDCLDSYMPKDVFKTLKKLYECVVVKGELWISTMSFEFAANQAFTEKPHPAFNWIVYGPADSPRRSAFTLQWLRALMEDLGLILRTAHQEELVINNNGNELRVPLNFVVGWKYEIANPAESIQ